MELGKRQEIKLKNTLLFLDLIPTDISFVLFGTQKYLFQDLFNDS